MLPRQPTRFALAALLALAAGLALLLDRGERGGGTGGLIEPDPPATTATRAGVDRPTPPDARLAVGWQVSAPRPGLDDPRPGAPIELGLRQRYAGPADRIAARVQVTGPSGEVAIADLILEGDAWAFLAYPTDFPGAGPTRAGAHRVRYLVDGAPVADDGFVVTAGG
jgi:hypothetical protein